MRTITTYRKSGRLFILRDMEILQQLSTKKRWCARCVVSVAAKEIRNDVIKAMRCRLRTSASFSSATEESLTRCDDSHVEFSTCCTQ